MGLMCGEIRGKLIYMDVAQLYLTRVVPPFWLAGNKWEQGWYGFGSPRTRFRPDRPRPCRELPVTWGCQTESAVWTSRRPFREHRFHVRGCSSKARTVELLKQYQIYWNHPHFLPAAAFLLEKNVLVSTLTGECWAASFWVVGGLVVYFCGTLINGENKFWFRVQTEE